LRVTKHRIEFHANPSRVIAKPFLPRDSRRVRAIITRVLSMNKHRREQLLAQVFERFVSRHKDFEKALLFSFRRVQQFLSRDSHIEYDTKLLLGSYFTHEYSVESTALFNPSMVAHPDQKGIENESLRFLLSLRALGEGHVSSIVFRSGVLDNNDNIILDSVSPYIEVPNVELDPHYDANAFSLKLRELKADNQVSGAIMSRLGQSFSYEELLNSVQLERDSTKDTIGRRKTIEAILWLAQSNYEEHFRRDSRLEERAIFPVSEDESNGIEDARFVRFTDDDGTTRYYATYTAYDGHDILPMMLETSDFVEFKMRTLNGLFAKDKGMALFPRRVNGKYAMIGRHDGENLYYLESDNIHFWNKSRRITSPRQDWELVQIGNCGSPIETDAGWLLLSHGVGPMRRYCIGALLLDKDDPSQVMGRLAEPLLEPEEHEREGYVPNVVYSCGSIIHGDRLIIPYALSDTSSGIAMVQIDELLLELTNHTTDHVSKGIRGKNKGDQHEL